MAGGEWRIRSSTTELTYSKLAAGFRGDDIDWHFLVARHGNPEIVRKLIINQKRDIDERDATVMG